MDIQAHEIEGWMSIRELSWLYEQASKSEAILEIGCYAGRSTKAMADATKGFIDTVDPLEGDYYRNDGSVLFTHNNTRKAFINNLSGYLNSLNVNLIQKKFEDYHTHIRYDFIFIDADHRYEHVKHDILKALRLLRSGGTIAGHDYGQADWPGVKKAVNEIFGSPSGSNVKLIDTVWYVECIK